LYHKLFLLATVNAKLFCGMTFPPPSIPGPPGLHNSLMRHTGYLISRMGMVAQKRFAERLEERDAAKEERLLGVSAKALARRAPARAAEAGYVVLPQSEPEPAPETETPEDQRV